MTYLVTVAMVVAFGLLMFAYRYLDAVAVGGAWPWQEPFINEMTGVMGGALLLPFIARLVRARPFSRRPLSATFLVHGGALVVFSFLHTSWNWATRTVLYPLAGLRAYDYGSLPWRYVMEFSVDVILYAGCAAFVMLIDRYRAQQAAVVRTAQLEEALARAEVRQLQLQLQPHFLFNALNTISSTMYEDVDAADRMLTELADLLRFSLTTARDAEVPLGLELEIVGKYAALLSARFGDRLVIEQDIEEAARRVLVPALLLQPLVENAIRHGRLSHDGEARVTIRAQMTAAGLSLTVEDDGGEATAASAGGGFGLSAIRRRLDLLHGSAASLAAGPVPGGYAAVLRLPARHAS
jgi:two-component system LytT family sensor kinase